MDTLTHALSGALCGQACQGLLKNDPLSRRARWLAGAAAAAFPDMDIVTRLGGSLTYLNQHRGVTHSLLLMPLWALALAWLFAVIARGRYHWRDFYLIALVSIAAHIFGDVITAYGTMLWAPFSRQKLAYPTTFIIDFYFSGIILAALIVAYLRERQATVIARIGVATLLLYIGFQATQMLYARGIAEEYAQRHSLPEARITVLPQPLSPYNWKLLVENDDTYQVAYVNLRREVPVLVAAEAGYFDKVDAQYLPYGQLRWLTQPRFGTDKDSLLAREAWTQGLLGDLKDFLQLPMLVLTERRAEGECAWFTDERFVLDGLRSPFQFGACRDVVSRVWRSYRYNNGQLSPLP